MSVEDLREYARRCAVEPELRARAKAIGFADPDGHIAHGQSLGLAFDMEDAIAFRNEMAETDGEISELSEDDLELVAGGAATATAALVVGGALAVGVSAAAIGGGAGAAAVGKATGW